MGRATHSRLVAASARASRSKDRQRRTSRSVPLRRVTVSNRAAYLVTEWAALHTTDKEWAIPPCSSHAMTKIFSIISTGRNGL